MGKIQGSQDRANIVGTCITGGAAGNHTVTGITTADTILWVHNLSTGADLTAEFSITAANTINNTGGTATAAEVLQVVYANAN